MQPHHPNPAAFNPAPMPMLMNHQPSFLAPPPSFLDSKPAFDFGNYKTYMPGPTVYRSTSDYHGPLTPVYDTPSSFTPAGYVAKGTDLNSLPFPTYTGPTWA